MSEPLRCDQCRRVIPHENDAFWANTGTVLTGAYVHPACLSAWLDANWPTAGGWARELADAAKPSPS